MDTALTQKTSKRLPINSLTVLKFIALLFLVFWHTTAPFKTNVDLGARMCELLFVISGFLVGYNYYGKDICGGGIRGSIKYTAKKIASVWPLHIITLLLILALRFDNSISKIQPNVGFATVLNVTLTHAWSSKLQFSYNGVSWFLSAIIFCYFLSPIVIKAFKNLRISIIIFILLVVVRIMIEVMPYDYFYLGIHSNPFVRSLEYFMGMSLVPLFFLCKSKLVNFNRNIKICLFTFLEVLTIGLSIAFMILFNSTWIRGIYVIMFCFPVFVISFEEGVVSKCLAYKPLSIVSNIQFELYLFQTIGIYIAYDLICLSGSSLISNNAFMVIFEMFTGIVLAIVYRFAFSKLLTKGMLALFKKIALILKL